MKLDEIADRLDAGMAQLAGERTPETWAIRVEAYRLLSKGAQVAVEEIAHASGHEVADVERCLQGSSDLTEDGTVEAFMGLSLRPTQHLIKIDGTQLYSWCALDLLFIPPILGLTAEIESPSPTSGEVVRAIVARTGVEDLVPTEAVVSVVPIRPGTDEIRGAFCNFVHFFVSDADASPWRTDIPTAGCSQPKRRFSSAPSSSTASEAIAVGEVVKQQPGPNTHTATDGDPSTLASVR